MSQVLSDPSPPPVPVTRGDKPELKPRRERRAVVKQQKRKAKEDRKKNTMAAKMGLNTSTLSPYVRIDRQFKTFKPLTPSLRWVRYNLNPHLHKGRPIPELTKAKRGTGGRNHHGHVTVRGRGGGHRRRLRMVDFWRWEAGPQKVVRIEYDPGRSGHIALIKHSESKKLSYILAPDGLRAGDIVESYRASENANAIQGASALDLGIFRTKAIRPGNVLPLHLIPIGTQIHAVSLKAEGSAKLVRSAGSAGQLVAFVNRSKALKTASGAGGSASPESLPADDDPAVLSGEGEHTVDEDVVVASTPGSSAPTTTTTSHAQVKLQSGEVRLVPVGCCATIGRVSNIDHQHGRLGKAGRARWMGRRPMVRGVAMNKVDHPHGGGRGKSKSNKHPRSIYNVIEGKRTRKPGTKNGNQMVIRERPRKLGSRKIKAV